MAKSERITSEWRRQIFLWSIHESDYPPGIFHKFAVLTFFSKNETICDKGKEKRNTIHL